MRSLIIEQNRLCTVKYFSEGYIEQHIMHEIISRTEVGRKQNT